MLNTPQGAGNCTQMRLNIRKMKNEKWTTADIPDLTGKVIIVTGAKLDV